MIRMLKIASIVIILIILSLLIALIGTQYYAYRQKLSEMRASTQYIDEKNSPQHPAMHKLLLANHGRVLPYLVAKTMLQKKRSHITTYLWGRFVECGLSADEQDLIVSTYVYMGNGRYGFSQVAHANFNKPLHKLAPKELSQLIVIAIAPNHYKINQKTTLDRSTDLLKRANLQ